MPTSAHHVDVAAYVLGILDEPEDAAFARHFATCTRCRTEYRELADLPRLLDQVKPEPPQRKPAVAARRRTPHRAPWLVAAAVILLVGISVVVLIKAGQPSGTPVAGAPVSASNPAPPTTTTTTTVPPAVAGGPTGSGSDRT